MSSWTAKPSAETKAGIFLTGKSSANLASGSWTLMSRPSSLATARGAILRKVWKKKKLALRFQKKKTNYKKLCIGNRQTFSNNDLRSWCIKYRQTFLDGDLIAQLTKKKKRREEENFLFGVHTKKGKKKKITTKVTLTHQPRKPLRSFLGFVMKST